MVPTVACCAGAVLHALPAPLACDPRATKCHQVLHVPNARGRATGSRDNWLALMSATGPKPLAEVDGGGAARKLKQYP